MMVQSLNTVGKHSRKSAEKNGCIIKKCIHHNSAIYGMYDRRVLVKKIKKEERKEGEKDKWKLNRKGSI